MIVMGERQDPFEVIDIYNHKILANQSVAAIRRTVRNQKIDESDLEVFKKLSSLLNEAYTADQSVSATKLKASSKYSLTILSQTLKAMEGTSSNTDAFRGTLNDLHKAAIDLSQGKIISESKLSTLNDFCKRYSSLQRQLLKQPSLKPSYGVTVWPFANQKKLT
jgi:hypothetical protein